MRSVYAPEMDRNERDISKIFAEANVNNSCHTLSKIPILTHTRVNFNPFFRDRWCGVLSSRKRLATDVLLMKKACYPPFYKAQKAISKAGKRSVVGVFYMNYPSYKIKFANRVAIAAVL